MNVRGGDWLSPVPREVPADLHDAFAHLQLSRLHASAPALCLALIANAVAMAFAVRSGLPIWQQVLPPVAIVTVAMVVLFGFALRPRPDEAARALAQLRGAVLLAVSLGCVAGAWSLNAFRAPPGNAPMAAPVFIAIVAMVAANCLTSVPRAVILGMATSLGPVAAVLLLHPSSTSRALGTVLIIIAPLKARLALANAREAVTTLQLQQELDLLARRDPLTGLANRRAFLEEAWQRTERHEPIAVALTDLDHFKAANDGHGHATGDAILRELATRMTRAVPGAITIARLGGDEFALLFDGRRPEADIRAELTAAAQAAALPYRTSEGPILVTMSLGVAFSPADGRDVSELLESADRRLYAHKASRQPPAREAPAHPPAAMAAAYGRRRWRDL